MSGVAPQPYWRSHRKVLTNGRLEWAGDEPSDGFWADLWRRRLGDGYFAGADRGDLGELEGVLVRALDPSGRHLDAGCGAGWWVAALAARGYSVEGVESSRELVQVVNELRPDLAVRHGDALALDAPDGHYASCLSFGVVEHRREGPDPFLVEARRVLRPGGRLVLSVPFLSPLRRLKASVGVYGLRRASQPGKPAGFFQYGFSVVELTHIVERNGFSVDEVRYLEVHRSLVEEVPGYFHLNRMRGARLLKAVVVGLVPARLAGHMVAVVATRGPA